MSVRNLDKILKPQRIAVVGASDKEGSVGYTVLANLIGAGFRGVVYPVNPKRESVQGIQAYKSISDLPRMPDLVVCCTPAETIPALIDECGEAGVRGVVIISAGFREAGETGRALERQVRANQKKYEGMRIIGPNCLGIMVPGLKINATFAADMPEEGGVAFISQSGALCTSVLDWALEQGIGFSYFISVGNMLDVSFGDLIDYFQQDPKVTSIVLYIESITDARSFISAARGFTRNKPIVAYKSGRFAESAKAAASHTGALAGEDAVYDAAFQRAGVVRLFEVNDMFDCAELLARQRVPQGPRLAIVTNAGGPGVMATDSLMGINGQLAPLSAETIGALNVALPPYWSHNNPIDVLGDAPAERFAGATKIALQDPNVDAVLVILTPQAMTDPTATAKTVAAIAKDASKPVLTSWMGGRQVAAGIRVLHENGIPNYGSPEQAIRAFMYLVSFKKNREMLYETPREVPLEMQLDREGMRDHFNRCLTSAGGDTLNEADSKALLEAYGIPTTAPRPAHSADEAVQVAQRIGYPVVLKVLSPQITHKTDVGGVVVNLRNDEEVRNAFDRIVRMARERRPDADVEGVTVQQMVNLKDGVELIIGAKKDPTFGSVIMVGMGGITAEILKDRQLALPPLNERLTRRKLEQLKTWPLLNGYRGRPKMNVDRLIEVLMRFSYLIADCPEIAELDMNPVLVTPHDAIALDARVILDAEVVGREVTPYEHLAIRPYPEHFTREERLQDGTQVTLRPIRPEDEPLWHKLVTGASEESLYKRFNQIVGPINHELAMRYCFVDYDRELAIVCETEDPTTHEREFIGIARMIADPDHDTAEYATLVADRWQGRGAGTLLMKFCLEIAKVWKIRKLIASTTRINTPMVKIFANSGFEVSESYEDQVVMVNKEL